MLIDMDAIRAHLMQVAQHYETSAPTVSAWADDLYIRTNEDIATVLVVELIQAAMMKEEGCWLQANYAANRLYHFLDRHGKDTSGHIGY